MALFTDSDHITQTDLQAVDVELPQVAHSQKIALEGALGIIRATWDECADTLTRSLGARTPAGMDPVTAWHTRTVGQIALHQITLAPQFANSVSPWKRWLIYEALKRFYRAATQRNATNDRFAAKFEQYTEDAMAAWRRATSFGLPVVLLPLSAPGAVHDLAGGQWSDANLAAISQAPTAARILFVAVTWVDATASQNGESAPSSAVSISLTDSQGVRVSTSGLIPPGSAPHPTSRTGAYYPTRKATHWNVYAGESPADLRKQNAIPVPIATASFDLLGALAPGELVGDGQTYDTLEPLPNLIYRA